MFLDDIDQNKIPKAYQFIKKGQYIGRLMGELVTGDKIWNINEDPQGFGIFKNFPVFLDMNKYTNIISFA